MSPFLRTCHRASVSLGQGWTIFCVRGNNKQDRQCMYNVISWGVRVTIVAVEKQAVLHMP